MAWGVVEGSWRASGPGDHCEAASTAASRLPPAATPPTACRAACRSTPRAMLGLPDRPPPRLRAWPADRRPPTAARRAPPATSDMPARRPACVPACLPARRPPPRSVVFAWSLLGPEDGGWWRRGIGVVRAAAASGVVVGGGGGVGRGGGSVVSGTGLVSAWGGWGVPQPHSRSDPLSERLFHIARSPFVVASVFGTLTSHTRGRGECASMP